MKTTKRKKLEAAGWRVGPVEEFLYPLPVVKPPKRGTRLDKLHALFEWRACYASGFPGDVTKRAAWLVQVLSLEGTFGHTTPKHLVTSVEFYRKLSARDRLRVCQQFFDERAKTLKVFTVLYRFGGQLVAIRREAPSAEDAAYATSAAVGHKCAIAAVMDGCIDFCTDGHVPQIYRFWDNPDNIIEMSAWRNPAQHIPADMRNFEFTHCVKMVK